VDRITVLSPVPRPVVADLNPGPSVDRLQGLTIGLRTEWIWPAYHVIADEWQRSLEAEGAKVVRYKATNRLESGGDSVEKGLEEFLGEVDLAVVGLGN